VTGENRRRFITLFRKRAGCSGLGLSRLFG
jgi:hypothetical protein